MGVENIFSIESVSYSFLNKFPALHDVSFEINRGERTVILGANGSGKSSLLQILDGLVFPHKGRVNFMGSELTETALKDEEFNRFFRKRVGLVFQNSDVQLFSGTVWDELIFGPVQLDLSREEIETRIRELSEFLHIEKLWDRAPYQLSGGEKKKVAIASTLAVNPDVLLLDEPTNGLDPRSQSDLIEFLDVLHNAGKTTIISTHDLNIARMVSDKAIVLNELHRVEAEGRTRDIIEDTHLLLRVNLIHEHIHCHDGVVHSHSHSHFSEHAHEHKHKNSSPKEK